jgi:phosphoribosylamine-glycine ligase
MRKIYDHIQKVYFEGMFYRKDIGAIKEPK